MGRGPPARPLSCVCGRVSLCSPACLSLPPLGYRPSARCRPLPTGAGHPPRVKNQSPAWRGTPAPSSQPSTAGRAGHPRTGGVTWGRMTAPVRPAPLTLAIVLALVKVRAKEAGTRKQGREEKNQKNQNRRRRPAGRPDSARGPGHPPGLSPRGPWHGQTDRQTDRYCIYGGCLVFIAGRRRTGVGAEGSPQAGLWGRPGTSRGLW